MSAGLLAARRLTTILSGCDRRSGDAYRRWEAGQWRRRVFVSRLALTLTRSSGLASRAARGLAKRPATLDTLLEVNEGSRIPWLISSLDCAALAGV